MVYLIHLFSAFPSWIAFATLVCKKTNISIPHSHSSGLNPVKIGIYFFLYFRREPLRKKLRDDFVNACDRGNASDVEMVDDMLKCMQPCVLLRYEDYMEATGLDRAISAKNTHIIQVMYKHILSCDETTLKRGNFLGILSKKYQFGVACAFDYPDVLALNVELLDRYYGDAIKLREPTNKYMRNYTDYPSVSECFPDFSLTPTSLEGFSHTHNPIKIGIGVIKHHPILLSPSSLDESKIDTDKKKSFLGICNEHPLTAIGNSGHLALIKHPFVQMYVDILWHSLARKVFYVHLALYLLFLITFCVFVASHEILENVTSYETIGSNASKVTIHYRLGDEQNNTVSYKSINMKYGTPSVKIRLLSASSNILLSLIGVVFEGLRFKTKGRAYWREIENILDLLIFTSCLCLTSTAVFSCNCFVHVFQCVLLVVIAIRASVILTPLKFVGYKFRMLLAVAMNVLKFIPVLVFFLIVFSVIFKSLLGDRLPFSNLGVSFIKTIAMFVGELNIDDLFLVDVNLKSQDIVALLMLIFFLGIMAISMMNLLIGVAIGDVEKLGQVVEQLTFKSKVDLILQYSFMFPKMNRRIHDKMLQNVSLWHVVDLGYMTNNRMKLRNVALSAFGLGGTVFSGVAFKAYKGHLQMDHKKCLEGVNKASEEFQAHSYNILKALSSLQSDLSAIKLKIEEHKVDRAGRNPPVTGAMDQDDIDNLHD